MARVLRQAAAVLGDDSITAGHFTAKAYEHPVVWDYIGPHRYLQVAVSESITQLYVGKFGPITSKKLSYIAAQESCLDFLLWTRSIGCHWDHNVFLSSCKNNQIQVLEHLIGHEHLYLQPHSVEACIVAARAGNTGALVLLREHGFAWNDRVSTAAAECGRLATLQYLLARGCPRDQWLCADACRGGHLETLRWLHAQGGVLSLEVSSYAAKYGDVDLLRWLHANNAPWSAAACSMAAASGSLQKLQFLRAHGCPWDYYVVKWSREDGHQDIVQWALQNGCPEQPPDYPGEEEESDDDDL